MKYGYGYMGGLWVVGIQEPDGTIKPKNAVVSFNYADQAERCCARMNEKEEADAKTDHGKRDGVCGGEAPG